MYQKAAEDVWEGRIDSTFDKAMFRLHQGIRNLDLQENPKDIPTGSIGFLGFKCDEGVRRNQGRTGSREAPDLLRENLASLPLPQQATLYDFGSIICEETSMEEAQKELGEAVARLLQCGIFPIILGGGHETAFGHYLGHKQLDPSCSLSILNIDAHFDLRPYQDSQTSSGTMFRQILDDNSNAAYFCTGIQKNANTKYLFDTAEAYGCEFIYEEEIHQDSLASSIKKMEAFIRTRSSCMLTLCCDAIEAAHAPGVSAPSPFGLHPKHVRAMLKALAGNPCVKSFDISEINPSLDENGRTVKLAAQLIYEVILTRLCPPSH
ncbi:formimidoylglutamase [Peribacillus kribbensis]|uniref:formimidoylglutamase n=1 Tax=Peribacillus kribbensis TaxID=356658 RepID=UPI0004202112|nr:formimidoylglutamase [Peribacillus kribbensis]